jgi:hypothetical protein
MNGVFLSVEEGVEALLSTGPKASLPYSVHFLVDYDEPDGRISTPIRHNAVGSITVSRNRLSWNGYHNATGMSIHNVSRLQALRFIWSCEMTHSEVNDEAEALLSVL